MSQLTPYERKALQYVANGTEPVIIGAAWWQALEALTSRGLICAGQITDAGRAYLEAPDKPEDIDLDAPVAMTKRDAVGLAHAILLAFLADYKKYGGPDETDMGKAFDAADLLALALKDANAPEVKL